MAIDMQKAHPLPVRFCRKHGKTFLLPNDCPKCEQEAFAAAEEIEARETQRLRMTACFEGCTVEEVRIREAEEALWDCAIEGAWDADWRRGLARLREAIADPVETAGVETAEDNPPHTTPLERVVCWTIIVVCTVLIFGGAWLCKH